MGRNKYDINRRAFGSAPPAQPTEDPTLSATMGEGVLDVVKDIGKKVGPKAVSGLTRKFGRKSGEKIVGWTLSDTGHLAQAKREQPAARLGAQPGATETANTWEGKEIAGDRIREILEANSLERRGTPPPKKGDMVGPSPGRRPRRGRTSLDETKEVNEIISRLLAEDD